MKQKNEKLKKNQKPFSCSPIHEKISSTLNDNALMLGKAPPPSILLIFYQMKLMKQNLEVKNWGL